MGSTLDGVDIVYIRVNILAVISIIHDGNFDRNALLFCLQIDDIVEEMSAVTVYIANEFLQTVLGMEHHLFCFSLFVGTKVCQRYLDTGIKECQFTHAACNNIPFV